MEAETERKQAALYQRLLDYEKLVGLCEQYDPEVRNSHEDLFRIVELEAAIDTMEAHLIVSAFMDRVRLRRAQQKVYRAVEQVAAQQAEEEAKENDRRLVLKRQSLIMSDLRADAPEVEF